MINVDAKRSVARRVTAYLCLALVGGVTYFVTRPQKSETVMEMPSGTVYYKGPMQGKSGDKLGSDELNPDIPDTSKSK